MPPTRLYSFNIWFLQMPNAPLTRSRVFAAIGLNGLLGILLTLLLQSFLVELRKLVGDLKPVRLKLYEDMFVWSQMRVIVEQARGNFQPF